MRDVYGRELETPLDLITQALCSGVDDPGDPYLECLRALLQEAHDHARTGLSESLARQRYYLKHHQVSYDVEDLVCVRTQTRLDAQVNFTVKLAPLYDGLYCVFQTDSLALTVFLLILT